MPEELKKAKDFSDEEKAAIAARAKRSELSRVAKDFGTTWQVVNAIMKAYQKPKTKAKAAAKTKAKTKTKVVKTAKKSKATPTKIAPRSSTERRLEILKRASEVGVTKAAAEAGISKWTVFQWRKIMKKEGYDLPPVAKGRTARKAAKVTSPKVVAKAKPSEPKPVVRPAKPKPATAVKSVKPAKSVVTPTKGSYSSLELENEMLKQKISVLTEQVERLRAAITRLA